VAKKAVAKSEPETSGDLALVPANPVAVLTDPKTYSEFYAKVKAECDAFVPDLSTATGRAAIAAQAYKVTRTKTAIDAAGKELNEEARAKINAVDEQRRKIRAELDALADEVRKPLTEWEAAEAEREKTVADTFRAMDAITLTASGLNADGLRAAIASIEETEFDADVFQESLGEAISAKDSALTNLRGLLTRAEQAERDAAELAELRRKQAEREEADRHAEAAREATDRAEREERERQEREAQETRDREEREARREAEARSEAAAEAQREAQARIDAANAEADRLRQEQAAREEVARKEREATEAREKDRAHRSAVMKAAKEAIMSNGDVKEPEARKIVLAIVAGEVPNVRIQF
jgi:colicin import membrane protein